MTREASLSCLSAVSYASFAAPCLFFASRRFLCISCSFASDSFSSFSSDASLCSRAWNLIYSAIHLAICLAFFRNFFSTWNQFTMTASNKEILETAFSNLSLVCSPIPAANQRKQSKRYLQRLLFWNRNVWTCWLWQNMKQVIVGIIIHLCKVANHHYGQPCN